MVRSFTAEAHKSRRRALCVLLAIVCTLALCVTGVSVTASAHNEVKVEDEQWVDGNGFRITYTAQGVNRSLQLAQEHPYDDQIPGLYSRIYMDRNPSGVAPGIDNWGKPIDFTKRFRFHLIGEQAWQWSVYDIASSTSAANVNQATGHLTIGGGQEHINAIEKDSIIHFLHMETDQTTPLASTDNVRIDTAHKGFATENTAGDIPVGHLNADGSLREYIYTFNMVSGNDESEKSTLTATTNDSGDAPDVFYLSDTQKTLAGKHGYWSVSLNGFNGGWFRVKLVQEHTLTITTQENYTVSQIIAGGENVTVSSTPKIWGGDLVKIKVDGDNADRNAVLKVGSTTVLAGEDGYWSFYMPNEDTAISVEQSAEAFYKVSFDSNGGSEVTMQAVASGTAATKPGDPSKTGYAFDGWFTDEACTQAYDFSAVVNASITLYAKWTKLHAVTYKISGFDDIVASVRDNAVAPAKTIAEDINPASGERANGWKADNLSLTWYADADFATAFDFTTAITADTTVYGKLIETKQYKDTNAYGWDELTVFTDDSGTQFIQSTHYATALDVSNDGAAMFNLTAQQEVIYSRALDVTRPIYLDMTVTSQNGAWVFVALWDKLTLAQIAYADNYKHTYGIKTAFGFDAVSGQLHPIDFPFNDGVRFNDIVSDGASLKFVIGETAQDSALYRWEEIGSGEEATEDWVKIASLTVVRSDFQNGKAYFSMAPFLACQAEVKLWQEIDAENITTQTEGNGTVTVDVLGGGSAIKVTTAAGEGYTLDTLTVNGKAATVNKKDSLFSTITPNLRTALR